MLFHSTISKAEFIPESKRRSWIFFICFFIIDSFNKYCSGYQVPSSDEGDTEDHSKLQSGTEGSTKGKKKKFRILNTRWICFPKITWKCEKNKTCCWKLMCSGTFVYLSHLHLKTSSLKSYPRVEIMWQNTWNKLKVGWGGWIKWGGSSPLPESLRHKIAREWIVAINVSKE